MARTETTAHRNLKRLALLWAHAQGYSIGGTEIRLPHSGYRADVVAYRPASHNRQPVIGTTVVFECKQSRSDFLKDSHPVEATLNRLKTLEARRQKLEQLLRLHLPALRKGESLFQEYDAYDFTQLEHRTYHRVLREIQILQNRLYGKTKFDKLTRYRVANLCYLVVAENVLHAHEVPLGWGLLCRQKEQLELSRPPVWQDVPEPDRLVLLHNLATVATRALVHATSP